MKNKEYITQNEEDTEKLGHDLTQEFSLWGKTIALFGNLGCGKTVFTRGVARGLGIVEPVSSPTFTIVQEYPLDCKYFYHLDLYRISDVDAAFAFGIDEFINQKNAVTVIEWPERIEEILNDDVIKIYFSHMDKNTRTIKITG